MYEYIKKIKCDPPIAVRTRFRTSTASELLNTAIAVSLFSSSYFWPPSTTIHPAGHRMASAVCDGHRLRNNAQTTEMYLRTKIVKKNIEVHKVRQ